MLRCRDLPGDPKHDPKRTARPLTASKPGLRKASGPNGGVRNDPSGLVGAGEMVLLSLTLPPTTPCAQSERSVGHGKTTRRVDGGDPDSHAPGAVRAYDSCMDADGELRGSRADGATIKPAALVRGVRCCRWRPSRATRQRAHQWARRVGA